MTNEEERDWKFFLHQARMKFSRVTPGGDIANQLCNLAERLLKENSELRVRDSNVTMHSLNVMAVNEDLVAKIAKLKQAVLDLNGIASCATEDCEKCVDAVMRTQPVVLEILEKP